MNGPEYSMPGTSGQYRPPFNPYHYRKYSFLRNSAGMDPHDMNSASTKQWRRKPRVTTVSALLSETVPLSEAARLEMKDQPSKTPVSLLQELLIRRGVTPKYELVQTEGQVHDPTFSYRVTVEKVAAIGSGRSKKEAKHMAAKCILDQLIRLDQPEGRAPANIQDLTNQIVSPYENTIPGNPIGTLQEMCMSRRWPPPTYIMEGAEGLPHERRFSIACTIYQHRELGTGKSKKIAKRQAAFKMWQKLRGTAEENDNDNAHGGDPDEAAALAIAMADARYACLRDDPLDNIMKTPEKDILEFQEKIKNSNGAKLKALQTLAFNTPGFDNVQALQEIAIEEDIDITYIDVEERSIDGKFQCIVQVTTLPVAVCYGCGDTVQEAQSAAANCTLEYFKILTKGDSAKWEGVL